MKKIYILIAMMTIAMTTNAQLVKLYKGSELVGSYISNQVDKVVFEKITKVTDITLSQTIVAIDKGTTLQLTATITPSDATFSALKWESSNTTVASVSTTGLVTGLTVGTAVITATATDGSGISATCSLTVNPVADPHEYVDLGLPSGRLWAKMNIGADHIYDYGDYFAWGETTGYNSGKTDFTWDTYKYYATSSGKDEDGFDVTWTGVIKYATSSRPGYKSFYDNKITLDPEDDAATANWGINWRMPTKSDWVELKDNCTWQWVTLNGVNGYKVTSKAVGNTNYIFLPAAGYCNETYLNSAGSDGGYWSSSLDTYVIDHAWYVEFYSGYIYTGNYYDYRYYGRSVRPVRTE